MLHGSGGWRRCGGRPDAVDQLPDADRHLPGAVPGLGLRLWLKVGPALGLLLSLAIFWGIQVPWSLWWLKHHDRGPLEAMWARLTYGRPGGVPERVGLADLSR